MKGRRSALCHRRGPVTIIRTMAASCASSSVYVTTTKSIVFSKNILSSNIKSFKLLSLVAAYLLLFLLVVSVQLFATYTDIF